MSAGVSRREGASQPESGTVWERTGAVGRTDRRMVPLLTAVTRHWAGSALTSNCTAASVVKITHTMRIFLLDL